MCRLHWCVAQPQSGSFSWHKDQLLLFAIFGGPAHRSHNSVAKPWQTIAVHANKSIYYTLSHSPKPRLKLKQKSDNAPKTTLQPKQTLIQPYSTKNVTYHQLPSYAAAAHQQVIPLERSLLSTYKPQSPTNKTYHHIAQFEHLDYTLYK